LSAVFALKKEKKGVLIMKNFYNTSLRLLRSWGYALASPKIAVAISTFIMMLFPTTVQANPLIDNDVTQGFISFLADAQALILVVGIPTGVLAVGYCFLRKSQCDETDTKKWDTRLKTTALCSIAAVSVFGFAPTLISHYLNM